MASIPMLKLGAAALIGLGAADLAWINLAVGPRALEPERAAIVEPAEDAAVVTATRVDPRTGNVGKVDPAKLDASAGDDAGKVDVGQGNARKVATRSRVDLDEGRAGTVAVRGGERTDPGTVRTSIYFASTSRRIGSTARASLLAVAARAGPHGVVHLEGHADHRGDDAYNEVLGKRRVDSAAAVLIEHGVPAARIERTSVGKRGAGEVVDTERWRDRRVDVWIEGGSE